MDMCSLLLAVFVVVVGAGKPSKNLNYLPNQALDLAHTPRTSAEQA